MQTFLPSISYTISARCLDNTRLNNQPGEVTGLLTSILITGGWKHHPAHKMWQNYPYQLAHYGVIMCEEWVRRGKNSNRLSTLRLVRHLLKIQAERRCDEDRRQDFLWNHDSVCCDRCDTCTRRSICQIDRMSMSIERPWWLGMHELHSSHRAALLEKDWEWYSRFGWSEQPVIDYFWPV